MEEIGMKTMIRWGAQMGELILMLGNSVEHVRGQREEVEKMMKALYTFVNIDSVNRPIISDKGAH